MPTPTPARRVRFGFSGLPTLSVTGAAIWYDANRITGLADAASVTTWADLSGNARDATQATAAKKPTYRTNIKNGLPVVRFDGGDCLQTGAVDLSAVPAISVYVACSAAVSGSEMVMIESADEFLNVDGFIFERAASNKLFVVHESSGFFCDFLTTATLTTGWAVCAMTIDRALVGSENFAWVNLNGDGSRGANQNTTGGNGNAVLNIGARNNAATLQWNGDFGELLVYPTAHTSADRLAVQYYLAAKWGIF